MSVKVDEAIDILKSTIDVLAKHSGKKPARPATGKVYRTYNDSIVFTLEEFDDGGFEVAVIRANHPSMKLVPVSMHDSYDVDKNGHCMSSDSGFSFALGLAEEIDINNL